MPPPNMQSQQAGIDLNQYNDLVSKGAVRIQRLGPDTFQMLVKRYDPANGKELPPAVMAINPAGLEESIKNTQAQIDELNKALENLKTAKTDMETMEANKVDSVAASKE